MADTRLKVVSIMDYPREPHVARMCYAFLDSVVKNGAARVTLLYETHEPQVAPEHRRAADLEVIRAHSRDVGHPHFNLRFKLPNLAALPYPFLYLDADMFVLDVLRPAVETTMNQVGVSDPEPLSPVAEAADEGNDQ